MGETDIIKGINALKIIADNLNSIVDYVNYNNDINLLPYLDGIKNSCSELTDIFEKTFTNLIIEKERLDDDGK